MLWVWIFPWFVLLIAAGTIDASHSAPLTYFSGVVASLCKRCFNQVTVTLPVLTRRHTQSAQSSQGPCYVDTSTHLCLKIVKHGGEACLAHRLDSIVRIADQPLSKRFDDPIIQSGRAIMSLILGLKPLARTSNRCCYTHCSATAYARPFLHFAINTVMSSCCSWRPKR